MAMGGGSGGGAPAGYSMPPATQQALAQANFYAQMQAQQLQQMQAAVQQNMPALYGAAGFSMGGTNLLNDLTGIIYSGGEPPSYEDWANSLKQQAANAAGQEPTPVEDPGPMPQFQPYYTSGGKSGQSKAQAASDQYYGTTLPQWQQKEAAYQNYLQQKQAWNAVQDFSSAVPSAGTYQQLIGQARARAGILRIATDPNQIDVEGRLQALAKEHIAGTPEELRNAAAAQANLDSANQRLQDWYSGKIPIDPMAQRELDRQTQYLQEQMRKQLGPGYASSSPYAQAFAQDAFNRTAITQSLSQGQGQFAEGMVQAGIGDVGSLAQQRLTWIQAALQDYFASTQNRMSAYGQFQGAQSNDLAIGGQASGLLGSLQTMPYRADYSALASLFAGIGQIGGQQSLAYGPPYQTANPAAGALGMGAGIGAGALSGALAGSTVGPWGTVIGGIGGALAGWLGGSASANAAAQAGSSAAKLTASSPTQTMQTIAPSNYTMQTGQPMSSLAYDSIYSAF